MAANDETTVVKKLEKSYFDVLGLCCSSEVPLIENILKPLEGIKDVSVIVVSRTVIVVHDSGLISQAQIVKALNQARLEANVRVKGEANYKKKWPSPFAVASGLLLLLSLLKFIYHPFQWVALAAVAVGIYPIARKALAAINNFRLDINVLAIVAVIGTIALKDYLEAGSIVFLFGIAKWLESRATHKATAAMSSLMSIAPQKAVIAETGEVVNADEVKVNTILAVKAGETIPIDGVVVDGKCEVDEKTLTGESFPVSKQMGDTVLSGTINLNGYIGVRTTVLAEDCVVAKMAKLVEEAQNNKSSTQRFIDEFAKYYTPAVFIISVCFAVIPVLLRVHNKNHWFHLALVVLITACPCALILSTPVATFCALSKAATSGLLIKGGDYLEILAKIKTMAFDKTGTITRGEFVVTDFQSLCDDISLSTLVYWVSSVESKSSHPMATALVDYGRSLSIEPKPENVKEFQNFPGEGIHGIIDGHDIYVGSWKISQRAGCGTVPTLVGDSKGGQTIGYIYHGATPAGIFSLSDACRSGVMEAVKELKSLGIKTAMLTGDSHTAAMHAQDQLGHSLEEVHAELLPEDKVRIVTSFKKDGPTAMIGDGVNDAPAIATADIGIAMGLSGSALATETGHVILMSNDIQKIPKAIQLARKAHRKIIENVILSLATKAVILALAFAGHPLVWAAVLADVGTCVLVIFNSMLLLRGTHNHRGKSYKSSTAWSNINKHGFSTGGCQKICEPQKCSSQTCASKCQTGPFSSSSQRENNKCTESACKPDGCVGGDLCHEAKQSEQGHLNPGHTASEQGQQMTKSDHCHMVHCGKIHVKDQTNNKDFAKTEETSCDSQPENQEVCCKSGTALHATIENASTSCNYRGKSCKSSTARSNINKHGCSTGGCQKICEPQKCSSQTCASKCQTGPFSSSSQWENNKCTESACKPDGCVGGDLCHEAKQSEQGHLNPGHTASEQGQQMTNSGHCHMVHCGRIHVKDQINDKDFAKMEETSCDSQPENQEVCCKSGTALHATIENASSSGNVESTAMHACMSLEKREFGGGCCKSIRKECCAKSGHSGFGGGLSEILIE